MKRTNTKAAAKADSMILGAGQNAVFSTDSAETGLNNNVIVCASSGGGKTMSILEPRLLESYQSTLVVTCTKRRIVDKYTKVFLSRGYSVLDLNFVTPAKSNVAYDPLAYVSSSSDISFLARSIVNANPRKESTVADPYWDDAAVSLLSALISYTMLRHLSPTFADVLNLLDHLLIRENGGGIETSLDNVFDRLAEEKPNCMAVNCWRTFRSLPIRTAGCVYSTLNTTVDTIFTPELRKMIGSKTEVGFEELARHKTVLFVTTSAVNPAMNCFINMFYAQMFKQLFEFAESRPDGKLPVPVSVLADDFATGSRILNFPEYISIFREKGISVTLLLQSESQLERIYGHEDAVTIIDNCDTYVYLGGMNLRTCRNISERLDVPLSEVLYMPLGQEIIFRRGQQPLITQRYNVLHDEQYQQITKDYEAQISGTKTRERR